MKEKCELCGEPSVTWIGDIEVCRRCADTFRDEARGYLADAIIDLAEAWGIRCEDAYDEIMDAGFIYFELDIDKRIAEREKEMYSQNAKIKDHLERYGEITPFEALDLYGCMRLAARVADLRAAGLNIETDYETAKSGARYAVYRLAK